MPSSYTSNLGIELPADGEQDGVWGDVVNDNMNILDRAINGSVALSLSGTSSTLTTSDGTLSNGQYKALILGGSPSGTHTITISPNDAQKIYFVYNLSGQSAVFTQGSGTNVTIANGDTAIIYSDGGGGAAGVVNLTDHFAMNSVKITGGTITGITDLSVADGGTGASDASTARTNLGLVIGTNVQAWDANLDQIAALAPTADNFIVGNGSAWTLETPANALLSLGVTSTAAELNTLDGITATTAELNYTDGVTSNIQTQLDNKQPLDAELTAIAALAVTDGNLIVGNGTTWVAESGATARTSLGLGSIATQDSSSVSITGGAITGITDLAIADGGTGASTAADARTNLGLGTMATQASSSVAITGGTITGITDLAIADGGTGASTAAQALINLGLTATAAELNYSNGVTSNIQTQLNAKAALASPALTGAPTAPTASVGTNTTQLATTAFVNAEIANDIGAAVASISAGSVGSSLWGTYASTATLTYGTSVAGSSLKAGSVTPGAADSEPGVQSGTWRFLGYQAGGTQRYTGFVRIS